MLSKLGKGFNKMLRKNKIGRSPTNDVHRDFMEHEDNKPPPEGSKLINFLSHIKKNWVDIKPLKKNFKQ